MDKIIHWPKRPDTEEGGGKGTAFRQIWRGAVLACLLAAAVLLVFSLVEWTVTGSLRPLFLKSVVWLLVAALVGIFSEHVLEMLRRGGGNVFSRFIGGVSYASFVFLAALLISQVIYNQITDDWIYVMTDVGWPVSYVLLGSGFVAFVVNRITGKTIVNN